MSILFDEIVFGPVKSRRFGISLGVNLLPAHVKYCTFDCIYCECGWTKKESLRHVKLFSREDIYETLDKKCAELKKRGIYPDHITFAGNGEPTIHPDFEGIISDTLKLRSIYYPDAQVTVLSNASMLNKASVIHSLEKVDNTVLKLDCGNEEMFRLINRPLGAITLQKIVKNIKAFQGKVILQSLFVRGSYMGKHIDNTSADELAQWLGIIRDINPEYVMVYSITRKPPAAGLEKISRNELEKIAETIRESGIQARVYG